MPRHPQDPRDPAARARRSLGAALALACAVVGSGCDGADVPDAADAGSDAGWAADAGAPRDAGATPDAGAVEDSGTARDAEVESDAGIPGPCVPGDPAAVGDTSPCTRIVYPPDAIYRPDGSGGRILDVTQPPFGARGDGVTDDTAALVRAYDFVMREIDRVGLEVGTPRPAASYVIYLPDGVYRVSDTIVYSGELRVHPTYSVAEGVQFLRFVGESREGTILRLDDAAPGFGEGMPDKPVLSFGRRDFNNAQASNALRNLTVSVGRGNPAAVGVRFGGANSSDISNVAIVSEDPAHLGAVGLDDSIGTVLSYQRDLVIDGFDVGVRMVPYHFTRPTLEHVTLRSQRVTGVQVVDGTGTLRAVASDNRVPALTLTGPGSHVVVVDSELAGGDSVAAAIELDEGHLFVRDVNVTGYGHGVRRPSIVARAAGLIAHYVSDDVSRTSPQPRSLALEVLEVPRVPRSADPADWASPDAPGDGVADASAAIQAAFDSGAATVYFPGHTYRVDTPIRVPCTVRNVEGMFTTLVGASRVRFRVSDACPEPLRVADIDFEGSSIGVAHEVDRTVVMEHTLTQSVLWDNRSPDPPTLFMNVVTGIKQLVSFHDARVFMRVMNGESSAGQLRCRDADIWILGFKSEKAATVFEVNERCRLEALGGIINQYTPQPDSVWPSQVAVVNRGAISIVAATSGPNRSVGFEVMIRDLREGGAGDVAWDELPPREGRVHQSVIPLFASY